MALATNLKVDPAIAAAFAKSEHEGTALLSLQLEGTEVKLRSSQEVATSGGQNAIEAIFAKIGEEVGDGASARLFLFKAPDAGHAGHSRWSLVSFVPEATHPKSKMLLAAARDDVKRNLEAARFNPDYATTEKEDLTAAAYNSWRSRDRESAMSARELAMQTVMAETNAARLASGGKMAGMAQVPFRLDDTVIQACLKTAPKLPAKPHQSSSEEHNVLSPASHHSATESGAGGAGDEGSSGSVSGGATGSPSTVLSPSSAAGGSSASSAAHNGGEAATSGSSASLSSGSTAPAAPVSPPDFDFVEMAIAGETILLAGEPRMLGDSLEAHKAAIKASVAKEGPKGPAGSPSAAAAAAKTFSPGAGLPGVPKVEPRYFLIRLGYKALPGALPTLLYYCPEGCPPRNRMTYSTAKAAVIDALNNAGVGLAKTTEARDEDELNTALENMLSAPTTSPTAVGGGSSSSSASSASHAHSASSGSSGKLGSPNKPMGFALPGMGGGVGFALPGMGGAGLGAAKSPLTPSGGAGSAGSAGGEGESGESSGAKRVPGRMGGFALPGLSPPGAK